MNIGGTYTKHFGIDFLNLPDGSPFPEVTAALNIFKKWRLFEDAGMKPDRDPAECGLIAARELFCPRLKITPWTETMLQDICHHKEVIFLGPASSGKSHVLALSAVMFYVTDPANTSVLMCSTTQEDLKSRAWSPVKELVAVLRTNPKYPGCPIKVMENEYCVMSEPNKNIPETLTKRATIRGAALEDGRLQGSHVTGEGGLTFLIIDELSTVSERIEIIEDAIMNISAGTDFRFAAAANPDAISTIVSQKYYTPKGGWDSVNVSTGFWMSKNGRFIRHFNGELSPAVLQPEMAKEWSFLYNKESIAKQLERVEGDRNAARYQKMVIGFPMSSSGSESTVLDPIVACREHASDPLHSPVWGTREPAGMAAGIDPAWSPDGDAAIMATVKLWWQEGKTFLDFQGGVKQLPIVSSETKPVLTQLRDGVIARINADRGPAINRLAVDSSGNQSLGDDLTTFCGPGILAVNSSKSASDTFLRAGETQEALKAKARIGDRGTESWFILAEFIRAGQVRGLPQTVVNDLCNRRYLRRPDGSELPKLKLESKEDFGKRMGKGSPNETDACALAAIAVKERWGVMPFGSVPPRDADGVLPAQQSQPGQNPSGYREFDKGGSTEDNYEEVGAYE